VTGSFVPVAATKLLALENTNHLSGRFNTGHKDPFFMCAYLNALLQIHQTYISANCKVNVMISSVYFWLATTAIVALIACYLLLLVKFKSVNESSDFSGFPELLQETSDELLVKTSKNLSTKRRRELSEKIKKERIKEYLDQKKRRMT